MSSTSIKFGDSVLRKNVFYAEVPAGTHTASDLLRELFTVLQLPGYFGFNWNALSDCLRDLSWLSESVVTLRHQDVPKIPHEQLIVYVEILVDAVNSWLPGDTRTLEVYFPVGAEQQLDIAES